MIASVSADHYNTTTLDGKQTGTDAVTVYCSTAPSVWETLLDCQLACLPGPTYSKLSSWA